MEYVSLSLLVDFPRSGPAAELVRVARLLVPVVLGAAMAGALVARNEVRASGPPAAPPPHVAWSGLAAHLGAFAVTATIGWRLLGPGAPPPSLAGFLAWLFCVAATVVLAATIALPPRALVPLLAKHVHVPLLAAGAGLLVWRAIALAEGLWPVLQGATLGAVAAVLSAGSSGASADPAGGAVGLGGFEVTIAPVCAGVDGLGLVLVFQLVWLSLARTRMRVGRAAAVLLPAGAAAAFLANVLRIVALIALGASGHEAVALGAFHSKAGWFIFAAIAFASVVAAERVPWLRRAGPAADEGPVLPSDASAQISPYLAAVAVALATSLWVEGGLDRWYAARVVAAATVLWLVRRSLPRPRLSLGWIPLALGVAVAAAWIRWGGAPRPELSDALSRLGTTERALWIAARLVGSIAVIPVTEELAFRGFLLPWLSPRRDEGDRTALPWFAIVVSSVVFGATHERWVLGTAAGLAFAAARLLRGRLSDAVLAHGVANAGVAAAALGFGRTGLMG